MTRIANCRCGAVSLEFDGEPIMTVACYCHSCQQAGKDLEALADASAVMDADDGTQYVMCRKDRVRCVQKEHYMAIAPEKIEIENVNTPGRAKGVDRYKFIAIRDALLKVLPSKTPGLTVAEHRE